MSPVHDAIILAAGMGIRLRSMVRDRPKGLIEIEHETLVGRSVRLLRDAGMTRITIVTGYAAGQYEQFARDFETDKEADAAIKKFFAKM